MPYVEIGKHRVLFLHIPKTGGTSIEAWLAQYGELRLFSASRVAFSDIRPQHYTYSDIDILIGTNYFTYIFTIVRDPYARMLSEYQMRRALAKERQRFEFPGFSAWLEENIEAARRHKSHLDNHFRSQHEFVEKEVQVFKYEDGLEQISRHLMSDLGLEVRSPVPHLMKSEPTGGRIGFAARDVRLVNQFFAEDFKTFDHFVQRGSKSPTREVTPVGPKVPQTIASPRFDLASSRETYEVSFLCLSDSTSDCLMRSTLQAKNQRAAIAAAARRAKALPGSGINAFSLRKVGTIGDGDVHSL